MNRFEELIAKYLDDTATPDGEAELAHLIQTNGENRQEFLACHEFDQLLTVLHKPANDTSIDAILTQLRAESDPFVESVVQEVRDWEVRTPSSSESWWKQISRWLDGRRVALGVSGALAMALITGLLIWFFGPTMGDPILTEFQGNRVSVERGTEFIPASLGINLKAADIVRTGTNETASVTFGRERTRIYLHPGTELKLNEMSRGKRFALRSGKIGASVARQRPFRAMVIVTPQAAARVLGTKFTLLVDTNGTHLEVTEGQVRLTRTTDGRAVKVTAGHYAVAAANCELAALPQTGSILHEYWTNVFGRWDPTWDSKLEEHPDGAEYLTRFEAAGNSADNFGERIRGYVHPPRTGDYTFWIAGDGFARFSLSRDDQPRNKVQLAVGAETKKKPREWTNQRKQQSSVLTLTAGRKYYIEAIQNDCYKGEHHLAVAWQGPDRQLEVIPGEFLSPFETKTKEKKR